jgi:ubiquinone/menaquinone biosynthesis C-methylase UbiE
MQSTTALKQYREQSATWSRFNICLTNPAKNKTLTEWTIDQLNVQPYQHILEAGYGTGYTLSEVARKLKIGFLAGIDESVDMYSKAYSRNKKLIARQLLQLHIGSIYDIAYPHHYFHTIYGTNAHVNWTAPALGFRKLASHLKTDGKLVMVFQPSRKSSDKDVRLYAEKISHDFLEAGLVNVDVSFRDLHPVTGISVSGRKG